MEDAFSKQKEIQLPVNSMLVNSSPQNQVEIVYDLTIYKITIELQFLVTNNPWFNTLLMFNNYLVIVTPVTCTIPEYSIETNTSLTFFYQ